MSLTEIFGLSVPVFALPPIGIATPELVAEASNAGALGVYPCGFSTSEEIRRIVGLLREKTDKPFGIQIFPPQKKAPDPMEKKKWLAATAPLREFYSIGEPALEEIDFEKQFRTLVDLDVPVIGSCLGGFREPYMEELEEKGIKSFGIASNLRDAKVLQSTGIQAVVARGWEAAGLVSSCEIEEDQSFIGSLALLEECKRALEIPVLVDASVCSANAVKIVKAAGADGFVASDALLGAKESRLPKDWLELLRYTADSSSLVNGMVFGRSARVLRTELMEELEQAGLEPLPFPYQWMLLKDVFEKAREEGKLQDCPIEFGQMSYQFIEASVKEIINYLAREF